jgi:hypothetical protein
VDGICPANPVSLWFARLLEDDLPYELWTMEELYRRFDLRNCRRMTRTHFAKQLRQAGIRALLKGKRVRGLKDAQGRPLRKRSLYLLEERIPPHLTNLKRVRDYYNRERDRERLPLLQPARGLIQL